MNAEIVRIAEKIAAAATQRTETSRSSVAESGDLVLGYIYGFDRPVNYVDIDHDWHQAYMKWATTPRPDFYLHEALLSHLPRRGSAGAEELDLAKLDETFDYLVSRGYLVREPEIIFRRRYSITDSGRAYFSSNRLQILARHGIKVEMS